MARKIRKFTDLNVWQRVYQLVKLAYKHSSGLTSKEMFASTGQMRRASFGYKQYAKVLVE